MKLNDLFTKVVEKAIELTVNPTTVGPISKTKGRMVSSKDTKSTKSSANKEESSTKQIVKEVVRINPIGRLVVDTYEAKKNADKINKANKEINDSIGRAKRLNDIVQEDLDKLGELKTEILASFNVFCDCMEHFQERPEISELKCKDITLPKFTLTELKTSSIDAKKIILDVAKKQFSWRSIALVGNIAVFSTLALSAIPILSLSMVASGIIFNKKSTDDDIWNEIENNKNKIAQIIRRLRDIDDAVIDFYNSLNRVNGYYNSKINDVIAIIDKYSTHSSKQISWKRLNKEDKMTINNCILFVGLLYEMCKVQVVRVDNRNDKIIINQTQKNKIIEKAEIVIKTAA